MATASALRCCDKWKGRHRRIIERPSRLHRQETTWHKIPSQNQKDHKKFTKKRKTTVIPTIHTLPRVVHMMIARLNEAKIHVNELIYPSQQGLEKGAVR